MTSSIAPEIWEGNEGEYVSVSEILTLLRRRRRPDGMAQPLCLWGAAGIGKTERVEAYCRENNYKMNKYLPAHDVSGEDLAGLRANIDGKTVRQLPVWLPREGDAPGVLFIDEINRAPQSVQDALLELCGAGTLSLADYRLPSNWQIVAAANPADLEHDVHPIDNAMIDRFLHMAPGYDPPAWAAWANKQENLDASAIDFALSSPENVESGEANFPDQINRRLKPTPRSYATLGFILGEEDIEERVLFVVALGLLGFKKVKEYLAYREQWKKGIRPLGLEGIINRDYEEALPSWNKELMQDPMIAATNERVLSGLMQLGAVDPNIVLAVGRYLASISSLQLTKFFTSAQRVAPHWVPALEEATNKWVERRRS